MICTTCHGERELVQLLSLRHGAPPIWLAPASAVRRHWAALLALPREALALRIIQATRPLGARAGARVLDWARDAVREGMRLVPCPDCPPVYTITMAGEPVRDEVLE